MNRPTLRVTAAPTGPAGVAHATDTAPRFGPAAALMAVSTLVAMVAYAGPLGNAATLATSLSASTTGLMWILNSMSLGLAVSLLSVGALADDFGRRRLFIAGAWVFAAGSVVCAVAPGEAAFVAGRLVQGVGASGMIATCLGLVASTAVCARQRTAAASWWGITMGAGIAVGPLLTGLLDLGGHWRVFYWLLVAAGAGIALAARGAYAESAVASSRRIDVIGLVTMTAGLALLVVGLIDIRGARDGQAAMLGVLAAALLTGFVVSQARGQSPMLELALLRRPDFLAATIAALATGTGVIALMSFACTFLVMAMGLTTLGAAALLAVWSATSAVSAVACRRAPAWFGGNPQLVTGLAGVALGTLLLTALGPGATPWRLVPGLLVAGVASGILNAGLGRQAVASAPPERAALGTGTNNTARYIGSSIGVTLVSVIAADPTGSRAGLTAGWNHAATMTTALSLAGAVCVLAIVRPRRAGHRRSR